MADTKIEWATKVWNPITGCTKISPGCANCYAERMAKRLAGRCGYPAEAPFAVTKHRDEKFLEPISWRKPARIFTCSMGDLFHDDVPDNWIAAVLAVMAMTYDHTGKMRDAGDGLSVAICKQRHTYMLLTKRPERMQRFFSEFLSGDVFAKETNITRFAGSFCQQLSRRLGHDWWMNANWSLAQWIDEGMPGLWLGVTAENQEQADRRIPTLLQTPAAVRFVSVEPMLGPMDLYRYLPFWKVAEPDEDPGVVGYPDMTNYDRHLNWVICGGESGPGARPMHPDWARSLRDQCRAAGVPFMFKQHGEFKEGSEPNGKNFIVLNNGGCLQDTGFATTEEKAMWHKLNATMMARVGKKAAGRLLDGELWDQYPDVKSPA